MKRKLALLMAAVMTMSLAPVSAFAAGGNNSENNLMKNTNAVPGKSVTIEDGVLNLVNENYRVNEGDIEFINDGNVLEIELKRDVKAGNTFTVTLDNAHWFFRNEIPVSTDLDGYFTSTGEQGYDSGYVKGSLTSITDDISKAFYKYNNNENTNGTNPDVSTNELASTYDMTKGFWMPTSRNSYTGSYIRGYAGADSANSIEAFRKNGTPLIAGTMVAKSEFAPNKGFIYSKAPVYRDQSGTQVFMKGNKYVYANDVEVDALEIIQKFEYPITITGRDDKEVPTTTGAAVTPFSNSRNDKIGVPYKLSVSNANDSRATITILADASPLAGNSAYNAEFATIYIPLALRTGTGDEVTVTVSPTGNGRVVDGTTHIISTSVGSGKTNLYTDGVKIARNRFLIDKLVLEELRNGALENGAFELVAPSGFYFASNLKSESASNSDDGREYVVNAVADLPLMWNNKVQSLGEMSKRGNIIEGDYAMEFPTYTSGSYTRDNYNDTNRNRVLRVDLKTLNRSVQFDRFGAIVFSGLELVAESDKSFDIDVMLEIRNIKNEKDIITAQKIKIGERKDYDVLLEALEDEIPMLPSGAYEHFTSYSNRDDNEYRNEYAPEFPDDEFHKSVKVRFTEQVANSWFAERDTTFTLPDAVKITKIEFDKVDNIITPEFNDDTEVYNNNDRNGVVTIKDNTFTLHELEVERYDEQNKLKKDKIATFEFELWLSIEPGFEGPIVLELDGRAIVDGQDLSVVIAEAVNPISIKTEVTDVQVGFQTVQTADITLVENYAGALRTNRDVKLALSDFIYLDMAFVDNASVAVTEGDLKINAFRTTTSGTDSFLFGLGSQGANAMNTTTSQDVLSFDVVRESTEASTVKISNVAVKVNRSVPFTNDRPYSVVAFGTAVAANLTHAQDINVWRDTFQSTQLHTPYVNVITGQGEELFTNNGNNGGTSINSNFTSEVRVSKGQMSFTVDGQQYQMDAAPYISVASSSMMVPIRFISNSFGISDDDITWDDANRTVTIRSFDRTIVQFKAGSDQYIINGVSVPMLNEQNQRVYSEMQGSSNMNSRMYIPFRQIGKIFGVPVSYDASTETAIYNER